MNHPRIRRAAVLAGAATALAATALAAPAAASAAPAVSFGCNSSPTFVSSNDGAFTGQGINIRSGPSTSCNPPLGLGYEGQRLKVWCAWPAVNPGWVFLNDRSTHVRGWSAIQFVTWTGGIPTCT